MTRYATFLRRHSGQCQFVLLLLFCHLTTTAQTIRYVSPAGTNANPATATSWATSTTNLQGAINASSVNGQVWVKAGTYKPTTATTRTISFAMKAGVAIYGGFVGTETTLSQRPTVNLTTPSSTTLSGEIGNPASTTDNSYHVISNPKGLTTTAILDGFVITGGNANSNTSPNYYGGGIYNSGTGSGNFCSPTIRNCVFQANSATGQFGYGGAMYNDGSSGSSSPSLTNCVLFGNGGGNTFVNSTATVSARYSLFEPSSVTVTGFTSVMGNLTATTSPFASTATTRLAVGSPAINAGDPTTTTATVGSTDLAGLPRFVGSLDMGALEFQDEIFTTAPGNWSDPAIWNVNRIPQFGDRARLKHIVLIPAESLAFCTTLLYDPVSKLIYETGGQLRLEP